MGLLDDILNAGQPAAAAPWGVLGPGAAVPGMLANLLMRPNDAAAPAPVPQLPAAPQAAPVSVPVQDPGAPMTESERWLMSMVRPEADQPDTSVFTRGAAPFGFSPPVLPAAPAPPPQLGAPPPQVAAKPVMAADDDEEDDPIKPAPLGGAPNYGQDRNIPIGNYQMPAFGGAPDNAALPANAAATQGQLLGAPPQVQGATPLAQGPGVGDRLAAGAQNFIAGGRSGGLLGALAGGISGLTSGAGPNAAIATALKAGVSPATIQAALVQPKLMDALVTQISSGNRDFAFKVQEAQRAQNNADRAFEITKQTADRTNETPAEQAAERAEAAKQYGIQPGSPEYRDYVFNGKLPEQKDKFQHVTVKNPDGSETPQAFNPQTGTYSGAAPPAPGKFSVDPTLTGQDRLEALRAVDPLYARKIESMVNGDLPMPTGVAALRPDAKRMVEDALAVDGATSASDFQTRAATRKDYAAGIASRVTKSINTTIGHFATLDDAVDKLGNYTYFPHAMNAVHDLYASNTDQNYQKAKATFEANKEAAVKELDFALSGGHSSVSGSAELRDKFSRADSPGALHAAITEAMSLLQKRLESHTKAFNEGTKSQRDPQDFIYPENQQAFSHLLGQPSGGAGVPDGAPAAPASILPPGNYVYNSKTKTLAGGAAK
jgi:hypothetical protein